MPNFDELLELYKRKSIFGDELLPHGVEKLSSKSKTKLTLSTPIEDSNLIQKASIMDQNQATSANHQEDEVYIMPICNTPDPTFSYLAIRAVVIDPYCELSAQRIVLPPTPYYSYSITPFFLRCPNMQSYKICHCDPKINKTHQPSQIKARFEFFANPTFLDIEPSSGQIITGQNIKINVIVRPRLTTTEITDRAKMLKAMEETERLLKERKRRKKSGGIRKSMKPQSTEKRQSKVSKKRKSAVSKSQSITSKRKTVVGKRGRVKGRGVKKGSKGSSGLILETDIKVNPQDMIPDENDLFNAKLDLMRYKEPFNFATKVVCYIESEHENHPYTKRKEELELNLYGSLVRPDIVVFTPPRLEQHIKFETIAVGMKKTLFIDVYNTSGRSVMLNHSFFDIMETYSIPLRLPLDQHRPNHYLKTGMWLEPDHHVKWPVIFAPKKEKTVSIKGKR